MERKYKSIVIICICAVIGIMGTSYYMENYNNPVTIGSNNKGYVVKDVYASNGQHADKIAVITGLHPRENIAIDPMKITIINYALTHNIEITDYDIHALDNPDNFTVGRANGEDLAAQYIVPDIKNRDYKMIIIFHAHQQSYNEGYFIATPYMDKRSVEIAQEVPRTLPSIKYYNSSQTGYNSTSAMKVSNPIAEKGIPTFVYEIPEKSSDQNVTNMTDKLLDTFSNITKNV